MSNYGRIVLPLVAIAPSHKTLGTLYGGVEEKDSTVRFRYCDQMFDCARTLQYGIYLCKRDDDTQQVIRLGATSTSGHCIHPTIEEAELAKGGGEGEALMRLSNFCREAWLFHEGISKPDELFDGGLLPAWGPLQIRMADNVGFRLYVTFPYLLEDGSKPAALAEIFDHRDYAHAQLQRQMHGRAVSMAEAVIKPKLEKKSRCGDCEHFRPMNPAEGHCVQFGHVWLNSATPKTDDCFELNESLARVRQLFGTEE